ncbi:MAG: MBL fold metallo-hydrolase, partial [Defluviitaleaceae bacterium]|nr:MBL fold metallo-hydrolase [Defluviitaleaceae bacterium]
MKINENVAMLTIGFEGEGSMHPVLVHDGSNLVLIDTGYPRHATQIAEQISQAGFDVKDLTHIILTHQDIDHVGAVLALMEMAGGAVTVANEVEAPYMDGTLTPVKLAAALARRESESPEEQAHIDKYAQRFAEVHFPVGQTVTDGQVLSIAGGIEIVHVPGHTPGHICLFLKKFGIMVIGDAAGVD